MGALSLVERVCDSVDGPMGEGIREAERAEGNNAMISAAKLNGMDREANLRYRIASTSCACFSSTAFSQDLRAEEWSK
jgi:hypothetical protein